MKKYEDVKVANCKLWCKKLKGTKKNLKMENWTFENFLAKTYFFFLSENKGDAAEIAILKIDLCCGIFFSSTSLPLSSSRFDQHFLSHSLLPSKQHCRLTSATTAIFSSEKYSEMLGIKPGTAGSEASPLTIVLCCSPWLRCLYLLGFCGCVGITDKATDFVFLSWV